MALIRGFAGELGGPCVRESRLPKIHRHRSCGWNFAAGGAVHGPRRAPAGGRRVWQKNSNHIGALCGLAAVSLDAGYPKDAERLLRHALKQSAHMPLIWRGLAQTFLQTGDLAQAE